MGVEPSCPALVIHDDDAFRKSLIAALDQRHFTVTFAPDGERALDLLKERSFDIVVVGLDLKNRKGLQALEYIKSHRPTMGKGIIILGDASPELSSYARHADETLMKPVDPNYVADRARTYCQ
jgi:DNA-binding response OmpR family regulator